MAARRKLQAEAFGLTVCQSMSGTLEQMRSASQRLTTFFSDENAMLELINHSQFPKLFALAMSEDPFVRLQVCTIFHRIAASSHEIEADPSSLLFENDVHWFLERNMQSFRSNPRCFSRKRDYLNDQSLRFALVRETLDTMALLVQRKADFALQVFKDIGIAPFLDLLKTKFRTVNDFNLGPSKNGADSQRDVALRHYNETQGALPPGEGTVLHASSSVATPVQTRPKRTLPPTSPIKAPVRVQIAICRVLAEFADIDSVRAQMLNQELFRLLVSISRSGNQLLPYGLAETALARLSRKGSTTPLVPGICAQYEAVRCISLLVRDADCCKGLYDEWAYLPLMKFAQFGVGDIQLMALRALICCTTHSFFQQQFIRLGSIPELVKLFDHSDILVIRFAMVCVRNLSNNRDCIHAMKEQRLINRILEVAKLLITSNNREKYLAVEIIANVCRNEEIIKEEKSKIITRDTLEVMCAVFKEPFFDDMEAIKRMNAVKDPRISSFGAVALSLATLSGHERFAAILNDIQDKPRFFKGLCKLLYFSDSAICDRTAQLMANLALEKKFQSYIVDFGIIPRCIEWIRSGSLETVRYACITLANLSRGPDAFRTQILHAGGFGALSSCLRSSDKIIRYAAARALVNLPVTMEYVHSTAEMNVLQQLIAYAHETHSGPKERRRSLDNSGDNLPYWKGNAV